MTFIPAQDLLARHCSPSGLPEGEDPELLASDNRLLSPASFLLFRPNAIRLMLKQHAQTGCMMQETCAWGCSETLRPKRIVDLPTTWVVTAAQVGQAE